MADIGDFIRQQLAAIQAMQQLQKSFQSQLNLALPKITFPEDVFRESSIQAALRETLNKNRALTSDFLGLTSFNRPAFQAAEAITGLIDSMRPIRDRIAEIEFVQNKWRDVIGPSITPLTFPALEFHLASVARIAETSRMMTGVLPLDGIGSAFSLSPALRAGLVAGFNELTHAYGDFYEGVSASKDELLALPPVATLHPATEYFNEVDLLESTTGHQVDPDAEWEIATVRTQIAAETAEALSASLRGRFPDLISLIQGARTAFSSKHADYERHFITSLRELFNHVLHRLAPDEEVKKFSSNAHDFSNNKPTRSVRLRYICRGVNSGRFAKFVEKDVSAAIELVDLLNGGTHEVACSYTQAQCRALMARAEGLIRFLLEIAASE